MASLVRNRLANTVTVITGGCGHFGKATARHLLKNEGRVALLDIHEDKEDGSNDVFDKCLYIKTDVCQEEEMKTALQRTKEQYGQIDYLVNCVGFGSVGKIYIKRDDTPIPQDRLQLALNINVIGTFNAIRLAAQLMSENQPDEDGCRGVIVNATGISAFEANRGGAMNAACQGAVVAMTLPLARDLSDLGIRVNAIAAGLFEDSESKRFSKSMKQLLTSVTPFPNRLGQSIDFAGLCLEVLKNPLLNGEVIRLDGGWRSPF